MNLYDNIDDMDPRDKPPEDIIEDDGKFDKWIEDFARKKEAEIRSGGESKSASSHKSVVRYEGFGEDDQEI